MDREQAYNLLTEMTKAPNLIKHGLAVEAVMRDLCKFLKEKHPEVEEQEFDESEWAIVGLLHDADYELVEKDPNRHTLVTEEKLRPMGVSERVINGIKAHHDGIKEGRDNFLEKAVYATDDMTGLIAAVALVRPDKDPLAASVGDIVPRARGILPSADAERKKLGKLAQVTVESVMKKFKERSFAAGAKREQIKKGAQELGIPLEEFVALSLKAMQGISNELGL